MPVRVIGWSGTPDSGATFRGAKNAREAENLAEEEAHRLKKEVTTVDSAQKDISVEHLFANIAATQQKVLKVIIKADVFGSAEAVRQHPRGHQERQGFARDRLGRRRPRHEERRAHGRRRRRDHPRVQYQA